VNSPQYGVNMHPKAHDFLLTAKFRHRLVGLSILRPINELSRHIGFACFVLFCHVIIIFCSVSNFGGKDEIVQARRQGTLCRQGRNWASFPYPSLRVSNIF
jgi:hypothetical protein